MREIGVCLVSLAVLLAGVSAARAGSVLLPPLDRELVGGGAEYAPLGSIGAPIAAPKTQAEERRLAWEIIQRVVSPVALAHGGKAPAFQTWYGRDDLLRSLSRALQSRPPEKLWSREPMPLEAIQAAIQWNSHSARDYDSFSDELWQERTGAISKDEHAAASLGWDQRVLYSPAFARHLLANYASLVECVTNPSAIIPPAERDLESTDNFSPCLGSEAPLGSVVIKARWLPEGQTLPKISTTPFDLKSQIISGNWLANGEVEPPFAKTHWGQDPSSGAKRKLVALHIAAKDLRHWVWITLWWSPNPAALGNDRPAALGKTIWKNYAMCVATTDRALPPGSPDESSWCANPYIEVEAGNARTNCIGCHQYAGLEATMPDIISGNPAFPDYGRKKTRKNFPTDYLWSINRDQELGSVFRGWLESFAF